MFSWKATTQNDELCEVFIRVLAKGSNEDWGRLIAVLDRLIVLLPDAWGERRDRGLAHAERGNTLEAMADLEAYLAHAEDGLDIDLIADRLSALRNANG